MRPFAFHAILSHFLLDYASTIAQCVLTAPMVAQGETEMKLNEFNQHLKDMPCEWKGPVIDVADTVSMARMLFEQEKVSFTASDLLDFTKMVLDLQASRRDAERLE